MSSGKRTTANINRIYTDIRNFVHKGIPDKEIIDTLAIPRRTFYTYKKKILGEDKALWREMTSQYLPGELLRLKSSMEASFLILNELWKKPGLDTEDMLAVLKSKDSVRLDIINLLYEGTEMITNIEQKQTKYHKS